MTHQSPGPLVDRPSNAVHKTAVRLDTVGCSTCKPFAPAQPGDPEPVEADEPIVDRYEMILLGLVALPLLATYVLCSIDALDRLVGLGIGLGALLLLSVAQGAIGASFFGLLTRECRSWAEWLVTVRRAG